MKKNNFKKRKFSEKAFSLPEMIIYIFMLTLLIGAVTTAMVNVSSSYGIVRGSKGIVSSAETLLNRFDYEVKEANNLTGTFGTSSGSLTLYNGATTTIFSLDSSGRVLISINGSSDYLTSSEVKVTKLTFYVLQASSSSLGVTLQTTITSLVNSKAVPQNFESTVLIREAVH